MLVLAADHVIQQEESFREAVRAAIPYAENGKLVTFGIVPDLPETGYGYIRRGNVTPGEGDSVAFDVAQFVENRIWKPRRRMWPAVNITGTAGCSCSALAATRRAAQISPGYSGRLRKRWR